MSNQYKTYYIIPLNILYQRTYQKKTERYYSVRIRSRVHAVLTTRKFFFSYKNAFSETFTKNYYIKHNTNVFTTVFKFFLSPFSCEFSVLAENTYTCIKNKFKVTPKKGKT